MASPLGKNLRYRAEWLGLKLLFTISRALPLQTASDFGGWLARSVGPHLGVTRVAQRNLQMTFPEWSDEERLTVIDDVWDNIGRYATEFPHVAALTPQQFKERVELVGEEHLNAACQGDKPAMLFSCHMANWEMGVKTSYEAGHPLCVVYRPLNNPYVEELVNSYRHRYHKHAIPKTTAGARDLLSQLRDNQPVALLIDQKMNNGEPIPFFGHDAMTSATIADMALKFDCPILPAQVERIGREARFKVTVYPPVEYEQTGDKNSDAKAIMIQLHTIMEDWIRQRPGQWFWLHRRWG